jgi:hypothetical protein
MGGPTFNAPRGGRIVIPGSAMSLPVAGTPMKSPAWRPAQLGLLSTRSRRYLALNLVGALVLAALAALDHQHGFLLLEGAWALVSAWSLAAVLLETAKTPSKRGPRHSPVMGDPGLEPGTSSLSEKRSNRLS